MSEPQGRRTIRLSARRYRWLDRVSKLLGVVLIAAGLHVGGGTPTGVALAALGVVAGLLTVIIDRQ